jgi:mono/diheme cytochrome c family protein
MRTSLLVVAIAAGAVTGCSPKNQVKLPPGTMPAPADKQNVTYAADIKPIFDAACIDCHGAKKQKAGLRLDSREAAVHGDNDGPVFEVGKSAESVLVINIARTGKEDDWMPPATRGKTLTLDQVALIRAWIDQGAK